MFFEIPEVAEDLATSDFSAHGESSAVFLMGPEYAFFCKGFVTCLTVVKLLALVGVHMGSKPVLLSVRLEASRVFALEWPFLLIMDWLMLL